MAHKIIKSGLAAYVTTALAEYKSSGEKMHVAIISALHNTATSGDVTLLNRINDELRSNDKAALRLYIRRASIVTGLVLTNGPKDVDKLDTASMEKMLSEGGVIGFAKGKFTCSKNPGTAAAKALATLCATRFINPDGETDKMVFERNNFAEHKTLNDADVLKAVLKPVKEALANTTDNKTYSLSEAVAKKLRQIETMLTVGHNQATLDKG